MGLHRKGQASLRSQSQTRRTEPSSARRAKLPRSEWSVLIPEHHTGFIDWATYEANRSRIAAKAHPQPHHSGGAVREGSALLHVLTNPVYAGAYVYGKSRRQSHRQLF